MSAPLPSFRQFQKRQACCRNVCGQRQPLSCLLVFAQVAGLRLFSTRSQSKVYFGGNCCSCRTVVAGVVLTAVVGGQQKWIDDDRDKPLGRSPGRRPVIDNNSSFYLMTWIGLVQNPVLGFMKDLLSRFCVCVYICITFYRLFWGVLNNLFFIKRENEIATHFHALRDCCSFRKAVSFSKKRQSASR